MKFSWLPKKLRVLAKYGGFMPEMVDYAKRISSNEEIFPFVQAEILSYFDDTIDFIDYCNKKIYSNQSIPLLFTGRQGVGKTISMYYLAYLLGLPMYEVYTREDLAELLDPDYFRQYHCVLIPDLAVTGLTNQQFNTKFGRAIQDWFASLRVHFSVFFTAIPLEEEAVIHLKRHFYPVKVVKIGDMRIIHILMDDRRFSIKIPLLDKDFLAGVDEYDINAKIESNKEIGRRIRKLL